MRRPVEPPPTPAPAPAPAVYQARDVLPFEVPVKKWVELWELPFGVGRVPIQYTAECWRNEDRDHCPHAHALVQDPRRPGESWVVRLQDLSTGKVYFPMTAEELEAWPKGPGVTVRHRLGN